MCHPSPAKQAALHKFGFGVLNKLYLRFPAVFWDDEAVLLGYMAANKGEWAEYLNIYKVTGQPILLCFNAGDYGLALEKMEDEAVVAAAMQVLRTIYGQQIPIPPPGLSPAGVPIPSPGGHTPHPALAPAMLTATPWPNPSATASFLPGKPPSLTIPLLFTAHTYQENARPRRLFVYSGLGFTPNV